MEANELRIGNFVLFSNDGTIFTVGSIEEKGFTVQNEEETTWIESEEFEPIPLTEEWLLKFGFKLNMNWFNWNAAIGENEIGDFKLALRYTDDFGWFYQSRCTPLKYVHQLQNLYFAITGEELIYKDNK